MKTTNTYKYKKGQEVHLDDIYDISGLAGGDWWAKIKEETQIKTDLSDDCRITRDIEIKITFN